MSVRAVLPDLNTLNSEELKTLILSQHEQLLSKDEQLASRDAPARPSPNQNGVRVFLDGHRICDFAVKNAF